MIHYAVKVVEAGLGTGVTAGFVLAKFRQEFHAFQYLTKLKREWPWRGCRLKVAKEPDGEDERKLHLVASNELRRTPGGAAKRRSRPRRLTVAQKAV